MESSNNSTLNSLNNSTLNSTLIDTDQRVQDYYAFMTKVFGITDIFIVMGGVLGLGGSLWIILQYHSKRILKSTPTAFIAFISYLDMIFSLSCVADIVHASYLRATEADIIMDNITQVVFYWCNTSYALATIYLSLNAFCVVRFKMITASLLDQYKWYGIIGCVVAPFFIYFIPLATHYRLPLFDIYPNCSVELDGACPDFRMIRQLLFLSIVFVSIVLTLILLIGVWKSITDLDKNTRRNSVIILKRLVLAYIFVTSLLWIPFFISGIEQIHSYFGVETFEMAEKFILVNSIANIFSASRGYVHALSVLYVYRSPSRPSKDDVCKDIVCHLLLIAKLATKDELQNERSGLVGDKEKTKILSGDIQTVSPDWSFQSSKTIIQEETMISEL